jgi:hypothetical protein
MKTIYFLDWLSQESGFSVPELVKEIKNELWLSISIQELIDKSIKNGSVNNLIDYLFDWEYNDLNDDFWFWSRISKKWENYIKELNVSKDEIKIKLSEKYIITDNFESRPKRVINIKTLKQKKL